VRKVVGSEPERVFFPEQWAEIARSISLHTIPRKERKAICDAIFDYDLACVDIERAIYEKSENSTRRQVDPRAKGLAALGNFIKYARGWKLAFHSVEKYLKREDLVIEAQQLAEQVYKFQKLAQHELDKISLGGRPRQKIRDDLVDCLAVIYKRLTGKPPTRSVDRKGQVGGEFARFVYTIFRARRIPGKGLPNAIQNAVLYVKNQH